MFLRSSRARHKANNKAHRRLREKLFRTMRVEPLEPRIVLAAPVGGHDTNGMYVHNERTFVARDSRRSVVARSNKLAASAGIG